MADNIWNGALVLLLGWIASPGGGPTTPQVREIEKHVSGIHYENIDALIRQGASGYSHPVELACDILRYESDNAQCKRILRACVKVAAARGGFGQSEIRMIEFVTDLLACSLNDITDICFSEYGSLRPRGEDLSTASYWSMRTNQSDQRQQRHESNGQSQGGSKDQGQQTDDNLLIYYGLLGLKPGASQEDIRLAYRRMAKVHHPDRFEGQGPEAQRASKEHFQKVQDAYERLMKVAA